MRICVRSAGGRPKRLGVALPSGLVFNRLGARVLRGILGRSGGPEVSRQDALSIMREIRRMRKKHPDWVLADIRGADGDRVYVKL